MIWTEKQIETLKELFPNNRTEDICSIMGFSAKSIGAKAHRLGLIRTKEHRSKMISKRNKMVGTDITYNLMKETAIKYKTRGEFQRLNNSIYTTARIAGLLDDICNHMIKGNYSIPQLILWYIIQQIFNNCEISYNIYEIIPTYELDIFIPKHNLAFEYDGKHWHKNNEKDLIKNKLCIDKNIQLIRIVENSRDYIKDVKSQLIENIKIINKYKNTTTKFINNISDVAIYKFVNDNINDKEDIIKIISKYEYYSDFLRKERNLYIKIKKRGLLEELTSHLTKTKLVWDDELIKLEVSKYEYLGDFVKNSFGCYLHIKKNKKEHLIKELVKKYKVYDIEDVKKRITEYEYLIDFKKENMTEYTYLKRNKLLELTKNLKRYKNRINI